jgi:histidinol-phosphatase (PHP family)
MGTSDSARQPNHHQSSFNAAKFATKVEAKFLFDRCMALLNTARMAAPADYHMHTPLCQHASGEPSEYAAHALALGLEEIGFSDHSPMRQDDFDNWRMRLDQLDEYVENVERARRDHPALTIKLSLEVDYLPGHEDWIAELAQRHPWDYLIGSVHYVSDTWAVDNPEQLSKWKERDALEVWQTYVDRLRAAVETGWFHILGHIDLPKKFGIMPERDCTPLFGLLLQSAAKEGIAVELNTAGLRKACREIYPSPSILQMARERGVPITFGSDAHTPEEVGAGFQQAIQLARSVGYRECCRFTRGKVERVAFSEKGVSPNY